MNMVKYYLLSLPLTVTRSLPERLSAHLTGLMNATLLQKPRPLRHFFNSVNTQTLSAFWIMDGSTHLTIIVFSTWSSATSACTTISMFQSKHLRIWFKNFRVTKLLGMAQRRTWLPQSAYLGGATPGLYPKTSGGRWSLKTFGQLWAKSRLG